MTDQYLQTKRIKIPYYLYNNNPEGAIKQLLGQKINIVSYRENNIMTDDESYIIDVEYYSLKFSPLRIFYINVSELKSIIPDSNEFVIQINNCNVKIASPLLSSFKKVIPIIITEMSENNYSVHGQLNQTFKYFGKIVRQPLNYLITPLKYPNHQYTPFKFEPIQPIYPSDYNPKFNITEEDTKRAYRAEMIQCPILKNVDTIQTVKSFSDCKMNTTAYLIDYKLIPDDGTNGIILIQPKRLPNLILFYPTMSFNICAEEVESIKDFLVQDEINLKNYHYCMNVLNA